MNTLSRGCALAGLATILAFASACTVKPLLATPDGGPTALSTVSVEAVDTRYAQEVRNHLIFLLYGGAGEPSRADYALDLSVTSRTQTAARVQVATESEPTASVVRLAGRYRLSDMETGEVVAEGQREVSASYDVPPQEYAALRAERDAEDRAARELAELIRLSLGQDMERIGVR